MPLNAVRVTRVSLSDWLALQARIRGFENPRLLNDRPSDGAAMAAKITRALRAGSGEDNWYRIGYDGERKRGAAQTNPY